MKNFTDNLTCRSRVNCRTCRDREGGRATREGWARYFAMPVGCVDFACPEGIPWGGKRKSRWLVPYGAELMCEKCPRKGPCPNRTCAGCSEGATVNITSNCPEGFFFVTEEIETEEQ